MTALDVAVKKEFPLATEAELRFIVSKIRGEA